MGFGDKLKDLRKQAQEAVTEHREQLHEAVDAVGVAANAKTRGKHTQRIAKFGEKASGALDKFAGESEAEGDGAPESAQPTAAAAEAAEAPEPTMPAAEPEAPASPPSAAPPPPSAPPPASNPDLAAWAAGDDGAGE